MRNSESASSIQVLLPTQPSPEKTCWACWDSTDSYLNPLIRVCRGCKDPDLQYIHSKCIDSFVNCLPLPRRPRSPRIGGGEEDEDEVLYDCARCRDPYNVEEIDISPLYVMWDIWWLRLLLILHSTIVLSVICLSIISIVHMKPNVIFFIWDLPVTGILLINVLNILSITSYLFLWRRYWILHAGKKRLVVRAIADNIV